MNYTMAQLVQIKSAIEPWSMQAKMLEDILEQDARIAELTAERDKYKSALEGVMPYIVTAVLEHCDGNKCRELWCAGCLGEDVAEENVEKSLAAYAIARNALEGKS